MGKFLSSKDLSNIIASRRSASDFIFFTSARRRASITATDKHFLIAAGKYEGVIFYIFRLKKVDDEKMNVHRS